MSFFCSRILSRIHHIYLSSLTGLLLAMTVTQTSLVLMTFTVLRSQVFYRTPSTGICLVCFNFFWSDWSYGIWGGKPQIYSAILFMPHLAEVVLVRFLHDSYSFPPFPLLILRKEVTMCSPHVSSSESCSTSLRVGYLCKLF